MTHDPLAPSPLAPGYRLDRYELLCPVAQGGMASVWLARLRAKHGFERLVAIKTILPNLASDLRFQQMFLDEARLASKIDHANVAHVLDLGDEHGVLYLVMEWVDGDSISKLQRALAASKIDVPFEIALRIMADACAGLHAAHELCDAEGHLLSVVHRDVSPQNVLISTRGIVKVIDFGIAKARDRVAGETSTGSLKGKIQFMAPEQAVGKPIDRRADVWAAGAVLYSLLSGEPPYDGPNQFATLHRIASGDPPARLPARVPAEVAEIAYRALQFEPDARFATAAVMQQALEAAMHATGKSASSADVAAFVAKHLAPRVEMRKRAVEVATRAAAERDRVERFLKAPDSSCGFANVDVDAANAAVGAGLADSGSSKAASPAGYPSTRSQLSTVPDALAKLRDDDEPKSNPTSPTLHASELSAEFAPPAASRRTVIASVIAVAFTVVVLIAVSVFHTSTPSHDDAQRTTASAPMAPAPIPPPPVVPAPPPAAMDVAAPATSVAAKRAVNAPAPAPHVDASKTTLPRKPIAASTTPAAQVKPAARTAPKTERVDDGF